MHVEVVATLQCLPPVTRSQSVVAWSKVQPLKPHPERQQQPQKQLEHLVHVVQLVQQPWWMQLVE